MNTTIEHSYRELLRPYASEIDEPLLVTDSNENPPEIVVGSIFLIALTEAQVNAAHLHGNQVHMAVYERDTWASITAVEYIGAWRGAARVIRLLTEEWPILHRGSL